MSRNPCESQKTVNGPESPGPRNHESTASLVAEALFAWAVLFLLLALQLPGISAHHLATPTVAERASQIALFAGAGGTALFFTGRLILRIVGLAVRRPTGGRRP